MALAIKLKPATTSRPATIPFNHPFGSFGTAATAAIPTLGPPGPAAPAPAPTPVFTPPPDPGLDQAIGGINATRDTTLAGLRGARTTALLGYGYNEAPNGALTFDPANPFSRAALLQQHYDQQRQGNTTSLAARGMLYSGALQNAQDAANRQNQQGSDALLKALTAYLAGNTQSQAQATTTANTNTGLAQSASLSNAIKQQLASTG